MVFNVNTAVLALVLVITINTCYCLVVNKQNRLITGNSNNNWIIHLYENCTHENIESRLLKSSSSLIIKHKYSTLLHGVSAYGSSKESILLHFGNCIKRIVPDTIKRIAIVPTSSSEYISPRKLTSSTIYAWGVDRIDQNDLPLNGQYTSSYTGANIDVYIVDTGIDTTHNEFASTGSTGNRHVMNIYDAFLISPTVGIPTDIDEVGHGTHVAGIIGGKNVGVSPGANIYGLKVLNGDGEGSTSNTVAALEYIARKVDSERTGIPGASRRAVVSMSLGGPCEDLLDCSSDTLVQAVNSLVSSHGVIVSVAAGNEGCNACSGSPNAASLAIRAGASDQSDAVPYFSNYGACVSVFAPGGKYN